MDNNLLGLTAPVKHSSIKGVQVALPDRLKETEVAPEIVAAITAAISTYLNISASQFVINSLKPMPSACNNSFWTIAGRKRQMEQRQDFAILRRRKNI